MTLIVHASCLHVCVQKLRGMRTTEVQNMAVHEMCEGKKHCVTFASNQCKGPVQRIALPHS